MNRISIVCPSRGRPLRFRAMAESALANAAAPVRVVIHLMVDRDDPELPRYAELMPHQVVLTVNEHPGRSAPALMNELALDSRGDIVFAGSDDILFRTPGWDELLDGAFDQHPDGMLVAYTNDGRDRDKCEHFAVSRRWIQAVGCFMFAGFEHFCADELVERIGREVGRTLYLRELVTEHLHFKYGKAAKDETYAMKRREDVSRRDQARLADMGEFIREAAGRVRVGMGLQRAVA